MTWTKELLGKQIINLNLTVNEIAALKVAIDWLKHTYIVDYTSDNDALNYLKAAEQKLDESLNPQVLMLEKIYERQTPNDKT